MDTADRTTVFRCPFETQGIERGLIHTVRLSDNKQERAQHIGDAFRLLFSNFELMALRLIMPLQLRDSCTSMFSLRVPLLPYQTEVIAAELDFKLWPFLWYHDPVARALYVKDRANVDRDRMIIALELMRMFKAKDIRYIKDVAQFSVELEKLFRRGVTKQRQLDPGVKLYFRNEKKEPWLVATILSSHVQLHLGDPDKKTDPRVNRNTMTIVKAPFYPKEFGRYSDDVEIIVTRTADFEKLPADVWQRIRRDANLVHRAHGVPIQDLLKEMQPLGIWIPQFK